MPVAVVPVALMGAFIGLNLFGFSINVLTLFGLVLGIGEDLGGQDHPRLQDALIVIDVVQEQVKRLGQRRFDGRIIHSARFFAPPVTFKP